MKPPTDQRPYWNRVAWQKTFAHPIDAALLARHVPRSAALLDLGCGYGRAVRELVDLGWQRAVGVDTAEDMVRRGREIHADLDLRAIAPGRLPFEAESFRAVLLFSVLTCIPDEAAALTLIREAVRVLEPGGVLYASDLLTQGDARNRARYAEGQRRFGLSGVFQLPEGVTLRHWPRDRVEALTADLEQIEWRSIGVRTMNGNASNAFQLLARRPV